MSPLLERSKSLSTCAWGIILATYHSVQSYCHSSSCSDFLHLPTHMYLHHHPTSQTKKNPLHLCWHVALTEMSWLLYLSGLILYMQSLLYFCIIALYISHNKKVSVVNALFRKLSLSFHAIKEKASGVVKELNSYCRHITPEVLWN